MRYYRRLALKSLSYFRQLRRINRSGHCQRSAQCLGRQIGPIGTSHLGHDRSEHRDKERPDNQIARRVEKQPSSDSPAVVLRPIKRPVPQWGYPALPDHKGAAH